MKRLVPVSALVLALAAAPAAARELRVGLAIPQSGSFELLGAQVREGFSVWKTRQPGLIGQTVEVDDQCDAETAERAAINLVSADLDIVVGFLCAESLAAALPVLSEAGIPTLTLSVRADIIGEEAKRLDWSFHRLAPRAGEEAGVAAEAILSLWADKPFAIIEDGTIQGRELAEAVRGIVEERGLSPAFIDNYRPGQARQPSLIRRLKAAGVSRVFIGGERSDIAIIARDAIEGGLELGIMAGDALHAAAGDVPLTDGTLAILADTGLSDTAPQEAREAFAEAGLPIEGMRLPAYAAADILGAVATRLDFTDATVAGLLKSQQFDTALGPVSFDENGERREPGFTLAVWRGSRFERASPSQILETEQRSQ
jgi:branched-chain amino acid transport system substrate-binding protein